MPGAWDSFGTRGDAIFGQQITVPAATKLPGWLVQQHGDPLPEAMRDDEELEYTCFRRLRVSPAPILATLGMPGARAMAVTSLRAGHFRRSCDFRPRSQS